MLLIEFPKQLIVQGRRRNRRPLVLRMMVVGEMHQSQLAERHQSPQEDSRGKTQSPQEDSEGTTQSLQGDLAEKLVAERSQGRQRGGMRTGSLRSQLAELSPEGLPGKMRRHSRKAMGVPWRGEGN